MSHCRVGLFEGLIRGLAVLALAATGAAAQSNAPISGPDPKEIPVPEIKTALGVLPGVSDLPVRKELPDPMVLNSGARVTCG
jgi:hypothetical protein